MAVSHSDSVNGHEKSASHIAAMEIEVDKIEVEQQGGMIGLAMKAQSSHVEVLLQHLRTMYWYVFWGK